MLDHMFVKISCRKVWLTVIHNVAIIKRKKFDLVDFERKCQMQKTKLRTLLMSMLIFAFQTFNSGLDNVQIKLYALADVKCIWKVNISILNIFIGVKSYDVLPPTRKNVPQAERASDFSFYDLLQILSHPSLPIPLLILASRGKFHSKILSIQIARIKWTENK